jgi:hypothetical protein
VCHDGHGRIPGHAHHGPDSSLAFTKFLNSHEIFSFADQSSFLNQIPLKLLRLEMNFSHWMHHGLNRLA